MDVALDDAVEIAHRLSIYAYDAALTILGEWIALGEFTKKFDELVLFWGRDARHGCILPVVARLSVAINTSPFSAWLWDVCGKEKYAIPFRVVSVTPKEVQWAITFIAPKDSCIVAAAHKSGAAYLATLDKRHLLDKKADIEPNVGFQIVRPETILSILRLEK
jgi:hypothetical protein